MQKTGDDDMQQYHAQHHATVIKDVGRELHMVLFHDYSLEMVMYI